MGYRTRDREIWDGIFEAVPDEWFTAGPSDAMVRCLAFFRRTPGRRVLDVGAGIGRWAVYLARNGIHPIVALDYAPHGSRVTRAWARREGLAIDAATGDAVALPFASGTFDAIVAALVLENLNRQDKQTAIGDLQRVAMPQGRAFFVFNPQPSSFATCDDSDNPTGHCHIEPSTDEEISGLLAGWQVRPGDIVNTSPGTSFTPGGCPGWKRM
jgi:ubiquinone/menaquinone biosynthesis C-methylase UbiE